MLLFAVAPVVQNLILVRLHDQPSLKAVQQEVLPVPDLPGHAAYIDQAWDPPRFGNNDRMGGQRSLFQNDPFQLPVIQLRYLRRREILRHHDIRPFRFRNAVIYPQQLAYQPLAQIAYIRGSFPQIGIVCQAAQVLLIGL